MNAQFTKGPWTVNGNLVNFYHGTVSLDTLIDYDFSVLPADSVLAYLDKRMPELEKKNQEPFHPEQCGPCWFCAFKKEQR